MEKEWNVATVVTKKNKEFSVPRTLLFSVPKDKINIITNLRIPDFY